MPLGGLLFLCTRQDSNLRPFGPEPNALSPELRVHRTASCSPFFPAWTILHGIAENVKHFPPLKSYIFISTRGKVQISSAY